MGGIGPTNATLEVYGPGYTWHCSCGPDVRVGCREGVDSKMSAHANAWFVLAGVVGPDDLEGQWGMVVVTWTQRGSGL